MASKYRKIGQEIIGTTIGRWKVLSILPGGTNVKAQCLCACGNSRDIRVVKLSSGSSKSCGCLRNDNLTTHGRTKNAIRKNSSEYWIWNTMKHRCTNPNHTQHKDYGNRGIKVCDRWQSFENFYADMGQKPDGLSLERRDNNKGYSPSNCYWADRKTQNSNKRNNHYIEAGGTKKTLTEWARCTGISHATIIARINAGWPSHIAATAPKWSRYKDRLIAA